MGAMAEASGEVEAVGEAKASTQNQDGEAGSRRWATMAAVDGGWWVVWGGAGRGEVEG